jgi:hypothetical protein
VAWQVERLTPLVKMFVKMLTHLHMMVYTWWCWHICKGEGVEVDFVQLGEEREVFRCSPDIRMAFRLNTALIHFDLD